MRKVSFVHLASVVVKQEKDYRDLNYAMENIKRGSSTIIFNNKLRLSATLKNSRKVHKDNQTYCHHHKGGLDTSLVCNLTWWGLKVQTLVIFSKVDT